MDVKVHKLKNYSFKGQTLDILYVITDSDRSPPILPLMYTVYLSQFGTVYESVDISERTSRKRLHSLVERHVTDATIRTYVYNLAKFLWYLESLGLEEQGMGSHASASCPEVLVENYLNDVLAKQLDSYHSLDVHRSSLKAYYNWLDYMGIRPGLKLPIYRKTRQHVAEKSEKPNYIQYVSTYWRFRLLAACETLSEKLIMRMGYEVGLRTSELTGLTLSGKEGLTALFRKLETPEFNHYEHFPYLLKGKHTKGGRSRMIYFDRGLLKDMKRYFDTERLWLINHKEAPTDCLFLRRDKRFSGTPINKEHASRLFRKRAKQAGLNTLLRYHDLRHTFATELYHEELSNNQGRETRSESAALIVVAQRLGHKFTRSGHAPSTTTRYIRMRLQMMELEK